MGQQSTCLSHAPAGDNAMYTSIFLNFETILTSQITSLNSYPNFPPITQGYLERLERAVLAVRRNNYPQARAELMNADKYIGRIETFDAGDSVSRALVRGFISNHKMVKQNLIDNLIATSKKKWVQSTQPSKPRSAPKRKSPPSAAAWRPRRDIFCPSWLMDPQYNEQKQLILDKYGDIPTTEEWIKTKNGGFYRRQYISEIPKELIKIPPLSSASSEESIVTSDTEYDDYGNAVGGGHGMYVNPEC